MAEITAQVSSSIDSLTKEFGIIAHNLANVSTTGYKRRCNAFTNVLKAGQSAEDIDFETNTELNSVLDFSQAHIIQTGRSLDLALNGSGFFVIETTDGPLYTRNGIFQINSNGQLTDSEGRIVAGQNGTITIPRTVSPSQLHVSADGSISAGSVSIGKFRLVDFGQNQSKLLPAGLNCFYMPDPDIVPTNAENIAVKQGFQEASNVQIIEELVDMMLVTRLYEANMKLLSVQSQASSSMISVAMG